MITPSYLEEIILSIPGYRGYAEKLKRNRTDKALRDHLHTHLMSGQGALMNLMSDLLATNRLTLITAIEALSVKLRGVADRLRFADYGYSGLLAHRDIDLAVLDQLYLHDAELVSMVDDLIASMGRLTEDSDGELLPVAYRLVDIKQDLERIESHLRLRSSLLINAAPNNANTN